MKNSEAESLCERFEIYTLDDLKAWDRSRFPEEYDRIEQFLKKKRKESLTFDPQKSRFRSDLALQGIPDRFQPSERDVLCLERSQSRPCSRVKYSISSFSSWVHWLYAKRRDPYALQEGIEGELKIQGIPRPVDISGWRIIFSDFGDQRGSKDPIRSKQLSINGHPLFGRPDFILRKIHSKTEFLIIEVKTTSLDWVPVQGWPDVRAQLWAYSTLDIFPDNANITLAARFWNKASPPRIVAQRRWDSKDPVLNDYNQKLFENYRNAVNHRIDLENRLT